MAIVGFTALPPAPTGVAATIRSAIRRARIARMAAPALVLSALLAATPAAPVAARPPPTVAVSYFDNNTGKAEYDPLAKGLADMLITDLGQLQALRVVEREKLNQILAELKL